MNPEVKENYGVANRIKENKQLTMKQDITLNLVKNKLETFQSEVIRDVENKISDMVETLIKDIQRHEIQTIDFKNFATEQHSQIWSNRQLTTSSDDTRHNVKNSNQMPTSSSTNGKLRKVLQIPEKIFTPRESYLTALLEIKHMRSIYNFFLVIFIFVLLNTGLHDYVLEGKIKFGFDTLRTGFGNFHLALIIWSGLQITVIGVFFVFKLWAVVRISLKLNEFVQNFWDYICLILFISFLNVFFLTTCILCPKLDLPLISSCCVLMEATRFMMKMHAFVRTNAARQIAGKEKVIKEEELNDENLNEITKSNIVNWTPAPLPKFNNYIYFLFAPTLIYRDSYPRTNKIRLSFAGARLLEVFLIIFLLSQIHERYMRPLFIDWCKLPTTSSSIVISSFGMMMPGLITMLTGFYCILHAWMNFAAEITQFADRMFYRDWWTTGTYTAYYRHWNIVVHDYLYEYIYRDVYYLTNGSKKLATITVFITSAFVHEVILSFGLRFVYPVMAFFFIGIGGAFLLLTKRMPQNAGNILIISGCVMGNGMMMAIYFMEYYARQNCYVSGDKFENYFIPVSWNCNHCQRS